MKPRLFLLLSVSLLTAAPATAQDKLPAGAILRLGSERLRHPDAWLLAYLPDGKRLVTGGMDARVWDVATDRLLRRIAVPTGIRALALTGPGGRGLATLGYDHVIRLWDLDTGKELRHFTQPGPDPYTLAGSPDGQLLAVGNWNLEVSLYSVATGENLHTFRGLPRDAVPFEKAHQNEQVRRIVNSLAFDPDGTLLAAGDSGDTVRLYDVRARKEVRRFRRLTYRTGPVLFSPDGKLLLSGSHKGGTREHPNPKIITTAWEVATGKVAFEVGAPEGARCLAFSPDGKRLAGGWGADSLCVWEARTGKVVFTAEPTGSGPCGVAFSPDGKTLAAASDGLRVWDTTTWRDRLSAEGHTGIISCAAFAPDGKTIVSSGRDAVHLWDAATGKPRRRCRGHTHGVLWTAFAPGGGLVASGGFDGSARLWDAATGKEVACLVGQRYDPVYCLAFAPDGRSLATTSYSLMVRLWDVATRREVRKLVGYDGLGLGTGWELRWSPDGRTLAGVGMNQDDGRFHVAVWDPATGRRLAALGPLATRIGALAYSPDAEVLAYVADLTVHVWDLRAKKKVRELKTGRFGALAFSPDGRLLLAGGRLLDYASGKVLHDFGTEIPVAAFSPDSRRLVTAYTSEATLLLWDVDRLRKGR
jgi:WD40 repeat protein